MILICLPGAVERPFCCGCEVLAAALSSFAVFDGDGGVAFAPLASPEAPPPEDVTPDDGVVVAVVLLELKIFSCSDKICQ